jgi:hypothetical protein
MFLDFKRPNKYLWLKDKLIPYKLADADEKPLTKKRYGRNDGSYVFSPELINSSTIVLSYGIGNDPLGVSFEQEMCQNGNQVFMYDGSIEELPVEIKRGVFTSEFLTKENFRSHIINADLNGGFNNILKMDIEGHEYEWLTEDNLNLLAENFSQISIEVHSLIEEIPEGWVIEDQMLKAKNDKAGKGLFFDRLNTYFDLFHIHANNHSPRYFDLPDSVELTYINKKCIHRRKEIEDRIYPIEGLDEPNFAEREDFYLDWWLR